MTRSFSFILLLVFFSLMGCSSSDQQSDSQGVDKDMVRAYQNNPIVSIPPSIFPASGNTDAKVKLDVFFDPWCGPCRAFDRELSILLTDPEYGQKVAIYFHLFPIGDYFPNDREASLLHLEMVKRNLYRDFRSRVVAENIANYDDMLKLAETMTNTKLPLKLLEKNNAKIYEEQLQIAQKDLKLSHTPMVFINNKEYPATPSIEDIKFLIDDADKKKSA